MRKLFVGVTTGLLLTSPIDPAGAASGTIEYRKPDGTLLGRGVTTSNGTIEKRGPDGRLISREVPTRSGGYDIRDPDGRLLGRKLSR